MLKKEENEIKVWKKPPVIKIYEALGSIADGRILVEKIDKNIYKAKVYSSSRNKFYEVDLNVAKKAVMANDNGSWFIGYLGYPSIALLMLVGELSYSENFSNALKNIKWKDINQKFKNDFLKTQKYIDDLLKEKGIDMNEFYSFLKKVEKEIEKEEYKFLGKKKFPPKGY